MQIGRNKLFMKKIIKKENDAESERNNKFSVRNIFPFVPVGHKT